MHADAFFRRFGPYGYTLCGILLSLLLGLPFLRYATDARSEPYPAVILPGGASIVSRSDTVSTYNSIRFYGRAIGTDSLIELNNRQLLRPIPAVNLRAMSRYAFNLDPIPVRGLRGWLYPGEDYRLTATERAGVWQWLNKKLNEQGAAPDYLVTRRVQTTVVYPTGERIAESITQEIVHVQD